MNNVEFNPLAKKIEGIVDFRGMTKWRIRKYEGEPNDKFVKDNEKIVERCTRKLNGFCEYAMRKGCTWEDFEKEYYGRDEGDKKIEEETKPKKE